MKKTRSVCLGIVALSVILTLATGCFRPAAPDLTPTPSSGAEAATPEESDLEGTAMANSTRAAQTAEVETAESQAPAEEEEPTATSTELTATATPAPPTATPATSTTTAAPTTTPTPMSVPTTGETTHVVQPGENMFRIALRYGTTVEAIARANGIANASQIYVGQELTIPSGGEPSEPSQPSEPAPSGTTYVVQPGDNLFRIALRYNMSYLRLAEYNGIANPSSIYVGQVLRIPPQ